MLTTLATYLLDWTLARGLKLRRGRLALAIPLLGWVALMALRMNSKKKPQLAKPMAAAVVSEKT